MLRDLPKRLLLVVMIPAGLAAAPVGAAGAAPGQSDPCYWMNVRWAGMTPIEQELMGRLGWNATNWDSEDTADDPPSETEYWADLTDQEREINAALGMTEERWDNPPEDCAKG